jgi:hypothetical protein
VPGGCAPDPGLGTAPSPVEPHHVPREKKAQPDLRFFLAT